MKQAKLNQDIAQNIFIDVNKSENQKSLKNIDVGTRALCIIKDLTPEKATEFRERFTACSYLQNNLPYDNTVIKYAQYLHPEKIKFEVYPEGLCTAMRSSYEVRL